KFKRKQFAYIRRWGTDIKPKRMKQMFAYLNSTGMVSRLSEGEFDYIHYYNGFFYLSRMGEDGKPVYSDLDVFGFTFSLNEYEHDKGASYPEVTTIIWDEFLTRGLYLTDEFVIFMNVVSTIIRLRTDIDIWLLGNTVNKYCPIFKEMGLTNILEMPQGTIDVYSYGNSG
ncbi:phage DNA encapsidation protein, partial [Herbiconiux daphne]